MSEIISRMKCASLGRRMEVRHNERGRASLVAVITSALVLWYVKYGRGLFSGSQSQAIYWATLGVLAIIALFSIGCAIHMKFIGQVSQRDLYNYLRGQLEYWNNFLAEVRLRLREQENLMLRRVGHVSRRGLDSLSYAKKIANALEQRIGDVRELVDYRTELEMIDAYELLKKRLHISQNSLQALIDAEPIPAIESDLWEPTLRRLLDDIDSELRNLAA